MRLKSIKASGFKSFADKIDIEIKDGITGIVGPNGSGKSNVVDAVRWVLGEQSVKALRGSKEMSDVIFQGSASRKPMTRASVTLVFDNDDHYLNSDYKEIEIKRIVYSSGENEYLLNNTRVRLKDITDLFLDSGAGREAFSIISQGKIGEILNSKPEDRRSIIEEAAGVLKYKKRKIDSLKKLEKTNDNLSKIDLIIKELSTSLDPIREQSEKARTYESFKSELESIEIALLVNDITKINSEYELARSKAETLRKSIDEANMSTSTSDATEERLKLEIIKIEADINSESQKLLAVTKELSNLEAEKQLIAERKKYEVDDVKLASNILTLKEEITKLESNVSFLESEIDTLSKDESSTITKHQELENDSRKLEASISNLSSEIALKTRMSNDIKNKIDIIESNLENDYLIPSSVKSVLNNPRLKGIHGTIGSLLDIEPKYSTAISTILGSMQNVVVVDDEVCASSAIDYLKTNSLGRVTFFPINIIKPRFVDTDTLNIVKSDEGFIGIASDLVNYQEKYRNIVCNQLGNALVVDNIDSLNRIGKKIKYTYRIVSLDGEILHSGGSMTGGSIKNNKNIISEKNRLIGLQNDLKMIAEDIQTKTSKLDNMTHEKEILYAELNTSEAKLIQMREEKKNKDLYIESVKNTISSKKQELSGTEDIKSSSLDKKLDETTKKYYETEKTKNTITAHLDKLKSEKSELNTQLSEVEMSIRKNNTDYNKKVSELNELEVKLGKMDIKLDNLLLRLNEEYDITYERAKQNYEVTDDIEENRDRVQILRKKIRDLGEVNTGAIKEFERLNERYEFLNNQRQDLKNSIDNILGVISEMDATMEHEFMDTFNKVNAEFKKTFNNLFKGGNGELVLTEPLNILETGIDIIAEPPGKKLKNITLLSGGEKTLTAIALLFAILNVKTVPFCILDEVEAALDEANVDAFGNYLKKYEDKTQFIVITHKKKTMEYANTLYGITMQESGVSKLVSVKLEGIK